MANTTAGLKDNGDSGISDALSYTGTFSLDWTPLSEPLDSAILDRYNEDNLRVLAAVALLDEQRTANNSNDDVGALDGEIARLHQKMNLLVDLLAFLVSQQVAAAPIRVARLSWRGVAWRDDAAITGDGLISLRLHRSVPQPFTWPAHVVPVNGGQHCACFAPLSEACQAALERHIFLHHRRAIAGQRKPAHN